MNDLKNLLSVQNIALPLFDYIINLGLTIFLSFVLSILFSHFGRTFSNRVMFAKNFVLLSTATMIVITIVKSSLALSLGLVGALSIVRFRTAVKEPEELVYLFLCITIGLGFGANQREFTLVGFIIIVAILFFSNYSMKNRENINLHLVVRSKGANDDELQRIVSVLGKICINADLKRFDEDKDSFEAAFFVQLKNFSSLSMLKEELRSLRTVEQISFFDSQGIT